MTRLITKLIIATFLLVGIATSADAKRVVLVIGNSKYEHAPALPNPANDARDLAEAFEELGYEVRLLLDATRSDLMDELRTFRYESLGAEHSIIYYAGHGVEIDRQNFVIPVDSELEADLDVEYEAIPLGLLVAATSGAKDLQLVVLDACRENPFLEQMTRTLATRSIGRGLALYEPEGNSLVAYAAKEGTVALDGTGENSPYATAFLQALSKPDLEIGQFFREVRDSVIRTTQGQQEPFLYGSLSADPIYFKEPAPAPEDDSSTTGPDVASFAPNLASRDTLLAIDISFWESIRGSDQASDFRDYLERFPEGQFSTLAERRLVALRQEEPKKEEDEPSRSSNRLTAIPEPETPDQGADGEEITLSRSDARDLQARLNILGFSAGVEDGLPGPRTKRAVAAFRSARDMGETDRIDRALLDKLASEVSSSRLAAYRERARQSQPAPQSQPTTPRPAAPQTAAPQAAAPQPSGNLAGFVGKTYCRKRGNLIENGQYFSDRPIRCYTILEVSQNAIKYRSTVRQQYGYPIQSSTFTRPRSGDRAYSPIALPSSGTGHIIAGGTTYVASSIQK